MGIAGNKGRRGTVDPSPNMVWHDGTYVLQEAERAISVGDPGRFVIASSSPAVAKCANDWPSALNAKLSTTASASRAGSGRRVRARRSAVAAGPGCALVARAEVIEGGVAVAAAAVAARSTALLDASAAAMAALDRGIVRVRRENEMTQVPGEAPSGCHLIATLICR